jgi:hypothetical protein
MVRERHFEENGYGWWVLFKKLLQLRRNLLNVLVEEELDNVMHTKHWRKMLTNISSY